MIERHELSALAKTMGAAVRAMVEPLVAEVRQLRSEVASVLELRAGILAIINADPAAAGRQVAPEVLRAMIAEAVAALPAPRDGKDADPSLVKTLVDDTLQIVVPELMRELSLRSAQSVTAQVAAAVLAIPQPQPGAPGRDAEPIDIKALQIEIRSIVGEQVSEIRRSLEAQVRELAERPMVPGPAGPAGPRGMDGDPVTIETVQALVIEATASRFGALAREFAVQVEERVAEAVAALPAPAPGATGEPGRDGKDAEPPHPDTIRLMVVEQVEKAVAALPKPRDGEKGDPGRDAVEVDILSAVDPEKIYARGTYAYHCGGIIRAFRATEPLAKSTNLSGLGWEVVVDGLHSWQVEQGENLRSFTISAQTTSGRLQQAEFSLPSLIYREIYQQGLSYQRGDVVTYGGSAWHCMAEATSAQPGLASKDWRLMVKEGRPGKPGSEGRPGKDGATGRAGQDLTQMSSDGSKH